MLRTSQRPILPDTNDRTLGIPGRNGQWDFGADLNARQFNLECVMLETNPRNLQISVSNLSAFLIDSNAKPRVLELAFDFQPERTYFVRYSGSLGIDRVVGQGRFTLPLIAFDPYGYEGAHAHDEEILYDEGHEYDDGLIYPNPDGFNWLYNEQHSSLYNYSTLKTDIVISISGTAVNPSIEHEQSGNILTLPDLTEQTLVIDTKKMTVKLDGANVLGSVTGDLFQLVTGANGLVFRCSSVEAEVSYSWKHKFM